MNVGKKRIALVIGSGAVKCAAALGLWQAMNKEGLDIDFYVGCSGGSLFSTVMALGLTVEESIEMTKKMWNREVTAKRNWPALLKSILPGLLGFNESFSMIDDGRLMNTLRSGFGDRTFADTQCPLYIVAADFRDGEQVVISEGRLLDAIRASIAVPYIWPAWQIGGRLLVDGSLANPLPIDVAIREGADIILAIGFESPIPRRVKSVSRYAFHINGLMTNNLLRANYAFQNLAHHAEIVTILPNFDQPVQLFDTDLIPYVIERGAQAAEEQLPYLKRLMEVE